MIVRIMVAIGGDDASYEPARVAGRLACALGVPLSVMSVQPSTAHALGGPHYTDRQPERFGETEAVLANARRLAEEEGASVAEADVLEGPTAETIINHARFGGFGLIVMGTRRRGRLQSAILGSVSADVAANSSVPVMIVPEPTHRDTHDEIE